MVLGLHRRVRSQPESRLLVTIGLIFDVVALCQQETLAIPVASQR